MDFLFFTHNNFGWTASLVFLGIILIAVGYFTHSLKLIAEGIGAIIIFFLSARIARKATNEERARQKAAQDAKVHQVQGVREEVARRPPSQVENDLLTKWASDREGKPK